jgi:hypothetical protein
MSSAQNMTVSLFVYHVSWFDVLNCRVLLVSQQIALSRNFFRRVRRVLQANLHFMKQKLTRYAFTELFTDDTMDINTMRGLLREMSQDKNKDYASRQEACRAALKAAVCPYTFPLPSRGMPLHLPTSKVRPQFVP